jgi:hypothetical protein
VLASLNTARFKGNDAAIQSDLAAIQTQSEIFYGGTGGNTYGTPTATGVCKVAGTVFSDATIVKAIDGAKTANGGTDLVCNNSLTAYAVSSVMSADNTRHWCVDSTGVASKSTTALGAATVCPAAN